MNVITKILDTIRIAASALQLGLESLCMSLLRAISHLLQSFGCPRSEPPLVFKARCFGYIGQFPLKQPHDESQMGSDKKDKNKR